MSPDTAYSAQEIFEAYKEALAMNALNQRRLLARIVDLEQEVSQLRARPTPMLPEREVS